MTPWRQNIFGGEHEQEANILEIQKKKKIEEALRSRDSNKLASAFDPKWTKYNHQVNMEHKFIQMSPIITSHYYSKINA